MHRSHLPLRTWFLAAHIVASPSNGILALRLQAQLGPGSCKSAWLLLHKFRRAMVDPDRSPLQTLVEIDATEMPFRSKHDPARQQEGRAQPCGEAFHRRRGRAVRGRPPPPDPSGAYPRRHLADAAWFHRPTGSTRSPYRHRWLARLREPARQPPRGPRRPRPQGA